MTSFKSSLLTFINENEVSSSVRLRDVDPPIISIISLDDSDAPLSDSGLLLCKLGRSVLSSVIVDSWVSCVLVDSIL